MTQPHLVRLEAFVVDAMLVMRCTCGWVQTLGQAPDAHVVTAILEEHLGTRDAR